jgi:hypothetical protein
MVGVFELINDFPSKVLPFGNLGDRDVMEIGKAIITASLAI